MRPRPLIPRICVYIPYSRRRCSAGPMPSPWSSMDHRPPTNDQRPTTNDHPFTPSPLQQLTYRELNERANRLAHHLHTLGVGPEVPVALCLERSLDLIIALLGV